MKKLALIPLAALVAGVAILPTLIGDSAAPVKVVTVQAAPAAGGIRHGDCKACHVFHGGVIRERQLAQIPHEIDGPQSRCTFCHGKGRLVPVPPSHWTAPDSVCLTCHKQSRVLAPALTAAALANPGRATLPASHTAWNKFSCRLCHRLLRPGRPSKETP